jgi:hypothetical protein
MSTATRPTTGSVEQRTAVPDAITGAARRAVGF